MGLLLLPMLASLWWAGAPGVQRRDIAWGLGGVAVYVVVRTTFSSAGVDPPLIYVESGLGFGQIDATGFSNAFGQAPYLFWVYNVVVNLMTVLFSEPRGGTFEFIHSLIEGTTPPWRWIHVATSLVTTSVGILVLMRTRLEGRQRYLLVLGCILILSSSLLGFLYARDRVGLVSGAGYAVLVFLTASLLVEVRQLPACRLGGPGDPAACLAGPGAALNRCLWFAIAPSRRTRTGYCAMTMSAAAAYLTRPCSRRCMPRRPRPRHLIRAALRSGPGAISSESGEM